MPAAGARGAPKHGSALLSGILRCRRCGRKLTVQYAGAKGQVPRRSCSRSTGWAARTPSTGCRDVGADSATPPRKHRRGGARAGADREGRRHRRRPQPQWPQDRQRQPLDARAGDLHAQPPTDPGLSTSRGSPGALAQPDQGRVRGRRHAENPASRRRTRRNRRPSSLADGPWLFRRSDLDGSALCSLLDRARNGAKRPKGPGPLSKATSPQQHSEMCVVMKRCRTTSSLQLFVGVGSGCSGTRSRSGD